MEGEGGGRSPTIPAERGKESSPGTYPRKRKNHAHAWGEHYPKDAVDNVRKGARWGGNKPPLDRWLSKAAGSAMKKAKARTKTRPNPRKEKSTANQKPKGLNGID